jgi:hypothetical protein
MILREIGEFREARINHGENTINHKEIREIEEIGNHVRMIDAPQ